VSNESHDGSLGHGLRKEFAGSGAGFEDFDKESLGNGFGVFELSSVRINSVLDVVSAHRLAVCPHFKRVLFSRACSPSTFHSWNMCFVDKSHCDSHGRCLKFSPCFAGVRVVWICGKLVGLPFDFGGDF